MRALIPVFLIMWFLFLNGCIFMGIPTVKSYEPEYITEIIDMDYYCDDCDHEVYHCLKCPYSHHLKIHKWCSKHSRMYNGYYKNLYKRISKYSYFEDHLRYRDKEDHYIQDKTGRKTPEGKEYIFKYKGPTYEGNTYENPDIIFQPGGPVSKDSLK